MPRRRFAGDRRSPWNVRPRQHRPRLRGPRRRRLPRRRQRRPRHRKQRRHLPPLQNQLRNRPPLRVRKRRRHKAHRCRLRSRPLPRRRNQLRMHPAPKHPPPPRTLRRPKHPPRRRRAVVTEPDQLPPAAEFSKRSQSARSSRDHGGHGMKTRSQESAAAGPHSTSHHAATAASWAPSVVSRRDGSERFRKRM